MALSLSEDQTRAFYNEDDALYRSFWDRKGNCHWGCFPSTITSFEDAMVDLNRKMLDLAHIDRRSNVLDLGCGNGVNSKFIYRETEAKVTGIDLSDRRIANARASLSSSRLQERRRVRFQQGTATNLPFENEKFSHVWSQGTIYHVHEKEKALAEVARVMKKGGIFIFDDLIKPKNVVSKEAKELLYNRLLFDTDFNIVSYQQELQRNAFRVLHAEDMSEHFAMSYQKLAKIIRTKIRRNFYPEFHEQYRKLLTAYDKTPEFVENGDIGWALFAARKEE
jgi:ubiquinone/menaquinone biosynthesis C-methylase UbiE